MAFHRLILLAVFLVVILAGCGATPQSVSDSSPEFDSGVQQDVSVYENTRFGYRFAVPNGSTVYGIQLEDQAAVPAGAQEEIVFVPGEETNYLTMRGIDTAQTAHEWLTANLPFFYPKGEAAQKVSEVDGRLAIILRGEGTASSPARLMVVQGDGKLLVLTFERNEDDFETLTSSLRLD